jgi:CBS-domain-containing membrane protein
MKALYIDRRQLMPRPQRPTVPTVRSVMSTPVSCVAASVTLAEALQLMLRRGLRHLVVLDAAGCCAGVLGDRVLAAAWAADPASLARCTVGEVLDPVPATVGAEESVTQVARFMRAAGTDAVAVLDGTCSVVGIVTGSDLIGVLAG